MSYNSHAKDIFIITGASRGLGRAIASELAGTETVIVLINRANAKAVVNEMRQKGAQVYTLSCDLSRVEKVTRLADAILKKVALRQARSLTLINCAGIITPIGFAGEVNAQEALKNLHVNAVSPILLSHGFLNISKCFKGVRLIVNISTGAAKRPIAGWGLYCSAKAALEMFSQCINSEQEIRASKVRVMSIDPGALDTRMQESIRRQKKSAFPLVGKFIEWHRKGELKSPQSAACEIVNLIRLKLKD